MQTDGNLVLYDKNGDVVWETHTSNEGEAPHRLILHSDGILAIIDRNGKTTWCSPTSEAINISDTLVKSDTL